MKELPTTHAMLESLKSPGETVWHSMTASERDDLQAWLRHGRIGTERGYQDEVAGARRIEVDS